MTPEATRSQKQDRTPKAEVTKQYFERWKRVGPLLDGIRFRELRAMTDEDRVRALTSVTACVFPRHCDDKTGWLAWQEVRKRWMKQS